MTITVQNAERLSLAEMREFVEGSRAVEGTASGREKGQNIPQNIPKNTRR